MGDDIVGVADGNFQHSMKYIRGHYVCLIFISHL